MRPIEWLQVVDFKHLLTFSYDSVKFLLVEKVSRSDAKLSSHDVPIDAYRINVARCI